jgi:hypothetical protein
MAPKKKIAVKRQAWNKGLQVGKRDGFTPAQVKRIRGVLKARGTAGIRDLALFSTAIDTMLQGHNLLTLVVADVQSRNGSIRPLIEVAQTKAMPPVRCALSKSTTMRCERVSRYDGGDSNAMLSHGERHGEDISGAALDQRRAAQDTHTCDQGRQKARGFCHFRVNRQSGEAWEEAGKTRKK